MDIFLIILAVLLLLITVILLFPVPLTVKVEWDGELKSQVKLFGKVLSSKGKGKTKKKSKKISFMKILSFIFSEDAGILGGIKYLLKKTVIKRFKLHVTVAGEDAASTAITYGGVCSLLYPFVGFIQGIISFKEDDIKILCDYQKENPDLYFFTEIKVRIITAIITAVKVLPQIKNIVKEIKENEQNS